MQSGVVRRGLGWTKKMCYNQHAHMAAFLQTKKLYLQILYYHFASQEHITMKPSFETCDSPACRFMNISHTTQTEQQTAAETSPDSKCSAV